MWAEITRQLAAFESAVLTGRDPDGYPVSVRCRPQPDEHARVLRVRLPSGVPLQPGPAGLLCHRHDEQLWSQRSFLVRGALETDAQGRLFRPRQLVPGLGAGGLPAFVRFVIDARRRTNDYLARRGLARPPIPWSQLNAVKAQAARSRR
jgi:hypothetical protein